MSRPDTATRLLRRAERLGLEVGAEQATQLAAYYDLLRRWNRTVNLTSLDDGEEALDRLLFEPVLAARHMPSTGVLLDVGSGGGSPALPLKISLPSLQLVMVESKTRKAAFLREATRTIGLEGVRVEAKRLEELLSDVGLHEAAGAISVRAVRLDKRLLALLLAFSSPQGGLYLFTGPGVGAPAVDRPWVFDSEFPLVAAMGSRLLRFRKDVPA